VLSCFVEVSTIRSNDICFLCTLDFRSHTSVEDSDHIFLEWSGLQDGLSCKKDLHNCGTKASDEQH
jgi:hypothetical protein